MILDGKKIAQDIKNQVKEKIFETYIKKNKPVPCLACIVVGDDKASKIYVNSKIKSCDECGLKSIVVELSSKISKEVLKQKIQELNQDNSVSGILLQLPLPKQLDLFRDEIINTILPEKDVDCLTNENLGKLFACTGKIAPCTATGILKIIHNLNYDLTGKDVVVLGRSLLVGKSVSILLQNRNATVTMCHSKTKDLKEKTKNADLVVVAIGKPKFVTDDFIKKGAIVIDVGINRTNEGLFGDVDFDSVKDKCEYITPVPGGVGPLTVACLLENTLILHNLYEKK